MAPAAAPAGLPAASRVVEGSARNREWESAFAARWRGRRGPLETVRANRCLVPLDLGERPWRPDRHHPKNSKQLTIIVKPVRRFLIRLHYRRCAPYEIGNQMSFHSVIERAEPAGPPH